MHPEIKAKQAELDRLCRLYRVERLHVFGSALHGSFEPGRSDMDFLVRFQDMPPPEYADAYFGLMEGLQELFNCPIDLVTETSVKNPWLRREIERYQSVLYAA